MFNTSNHVDDGLLEKFSLGDVTKEEEIICEEHLLICSDGRCSGSLLDWDEYHLGIRVALATFDLSHSPEKRRPPPDEQGYLPLGLRGQVRAGPI